MVTFGRSFTAFVLVATFALLAAPVRADDAAAPGDTPEVVAQAETQTPPPAQEEKKKGVEEIIVTATKREQSIQDVPIAVSAFSGDDLAMRGVEDLSSLQNVSPSLNVYSSNSTTNGGTIRIRGVGTTGNNLGLESAVGTFIDGVYRSRSGLAFGDLVDVERVEVLRGPQGTLFGKNTSAGAVHLITKRPEFDWHGGGSFTVGNYGQTSGKASITGPLVDEKIAFRLASFWTHRDGHYENIGDNEAFDERDRKGLRGQMLFNVTDSFDFRLIGDWTERHESCCPATYLLPDPPNSPAGIPNSSSEAIVLLGGHQPVDFDSWQTNVGTNYDPYEKVSDWGLSGEANWELGFAKLTSISAWRQFRVNRGQDIDFSDADILADPGTSEHWNNWSQEFRLAGSAEVGLPIDWLVGAYGYTERVRSKTDVRFGAEGGAYINLLSGAPAALWPEGTGYFFEAWQNGSGWSLFTHDTLHITDAFSFTAGFRWSDETKKGKGKPNGAGHNQIINEPTFYCTALADADNAVRAALCDNAGYEGKRREREWSGTFNFAYEFTDSLNGYIGYSRGYKAGGFNLDVDANAAVTFDPDDPDGPGLVVPPDGTSPFADGPLPAAFTGEFSNAFEFDPEFVDLYEAGLKMRMFDDRVSVNTAIFYAKYKNFQLNTFTGLGFFIQNMPEVVSQGIEVEAMMNLFDGVYATVGGTYAPARYGDQSEFIQTSGAYIDPTTGQPFVVSDQLRNEIITQAPRFQANVSLNVEQPLVDTGWTWLMGTNVSYRGSMNTGSDLDSVKEVGSVWLWNGQIGVRTPDQRWTAMLWGENLTNKRVMALGFDSVFQTGSFSAFTNTPRLYGVRLEYAY